MAADEFNLTARAVTITAPKIQPIYEAIDISAYDSLTFAIGSLALSGFTGSCVLELWSGMQKQTTSGYVKINTATIDLVQNTWQYARVSRSTTPMFKYLLWNITQMVGSSPSACFFVSCLGRKWGG